MALPLKIIKGLLAGLGPNQIKDIILLQRSLEHQFTLEQYTQEQLIKINNSLNQAKREIERKIRKPSTKPYTKRTLQKRLTEILIMTEGIRGKLTNDITKISLEAAKLSIAAHNDILSFGERVVGYKALKMNSDVLRSMITDVPVGGYILSDWIDAMFTNELKSKLQNEFATGAFSGESTDALARRIALGFNNISNREAVTLARTYVQEVNVNAMEAVYAKNTNIVRGVKWSAVLESGDTKTGTGTCPRCAGLDGVEFGIKSHPPCPLHPRCRCLLLPVTKSYRELGLDIEEIQKVYRPTRIADTLKKGGKDKIDFLQGNYEDFYLKQSIEFQSNVVGPVRASMIAGGQISFSDLVDRKTGALVPISQLKSFKKK